MNRSATALTVACGGTFLGFLDATVTNLALPEIGADYSVGVTTLGWVVTAYAIPLAALLAPAGAIADAVGRARLAAIGMAIFTSASLIVSVAPTYGVVVTGRVIQGAGAALLIPAGLALLLTEIPAERRLRAIGAWSAAGGVAAAIGPALGGIIVDAFDWRALFLINLPLGGWLLWCATGLRAGERARGRFPDLTGSLLLAAAIAGLVYGTSQGSDRGWTDGWVVGGFALALVAGASAVRRAFSHHTPALRVDLLSVRPFAVAALASLLYGVGLFATMLVGVLFLVGAWHYSPLEAGLAMTPCSIVVALVAIGTGRLPVRPSPPTLVAAGFVVQGVALGGCALELGHEPRLWTVWLPLGVLLGIGTGLATVGVSSAAVAAVAPQDFAAGTGLVSAARQVGGALGVAILTALLAGHASTEIGPYHAVYALSASASGLAAACALGLRPMRTPVREAVRA